MWLGSSVDRRLDSSDNRKHHGFKSCWNLIFSDFFFDPLLCEHYCEGHGFHLWFHPQITCMRLHTYIFTFMYWKSCSKVKVKSIFKPGGPSVLPLNSSFCSMKWLGVLLFPLDGMLVYRKVLSPTSSIMIARTDLHTWVKRDNVE